MAPTPGRIVNFTDKGGTRPALIQYVHADLTTVDLWVFGVSQVFKLCKIREGEGIDSWSWPDPSPPVPAQIGQALAGPSYHPSQAKIERRK